MKKQFVFEVDEGVADKAEAIYLALGMDLEMAIGVFLRRTVLENRFPIEMGLPASTAAQQPAPQVDANLSTREVLNYEDEAYSPPRENSKITQPMVEALWAEFKNYCNSTGGDIRGISNHVSHETGMNPGSAFIYMNILNNLLSGTSNTRNMKMKDLEFYMAKIKEEFGEEEYQKALTSLELSVPYWDKPTFGYFAQHVKDYLKKKGASGEQ
jgi:antitoxin component of RelBE/YafQ-DinJ toxin-antitoxin module